MWTCASKNTHNLYNRWNNCKDQWTKAPEKNGWEGAVGVGEVLRLELEDCIDLICGLEFRRMVLWIHRNLTETAVAVAVAEVEGPKPPKMPNHDEDDLDLKNTSPEIQKEEIWRWKWRENVRYGRERVRFWTDQKQCPWNVSVQASTVGQPLIPFSGFLFLFFMYLFWIELRWPCSFSFFLFLNQVTYYSLRHATSLCFSTWNLGSGFYMGWALNADTSEKIGTNMTQSPMPSITSMNHHIYIYI